MRLILKPVSLNEPQYCVRFSRQWAQLTCAVLCMTILCGCRAQSTAAPGLRYAVTIEPSPPKVGDAQVTVAVQDAVGKPVEGAKVRVEGNMNHAGMKPAFADLDQEPEPGKYSGTLHFTMGGDWFLLITTTTPDGVKTEHKVDVPGVRSQ